MGFSTKAIHAGQEPDPSTGAVVVPIFQTSTYVQKGANADGRFDYSRTVNPTRSALEGNLAALEGGAFGLCFSSGMAAIHALLHLLKAGEHVVVTDNVYGGTYRLFETVMRDLGLDFSWVDTSDPARTRESIRPDTRMVFLETPTNPVMRLADIAATAEVCRGEAILLAVDNTFMSPFFQRPLELGADIVVHSTTKFLNGHSDSIGGALITSEEETADRLQHVQASAGAILSPFDSWLVLRGTKTLAIRMERHDANGRRIAQWLEEHPSVDRVLYPGLDTHPQRELAERQMSGFGGMISFDVGSRERAWKILDGVRLFSKAESLGGVESLICYPATMTHGSVPREKQLQLGITEGLVRISVGIEDVEDLIEDLDTTLASL
jgi:cystathionine beta-lyase/cystathionine gamma-synthase